MIGTNEKPQSDGKQIETVNRYGISTMSMGFMVEDENPIIWRGLMVMKAINEMIDKVNWGEADIMIIDLPPGTGDVQISLAQKLKITASVIVTTPQDVALVDVVRGLKMFEKTEIPIYGIIENMSYFLAPEPDSDSVSGSKSFVIGVKYKYLLHSPKPMMKSSDFSPNHKDIL